MTFVKDALPKDWARFRPEPRSGGLLEAWDLGAAAASEGPAEAMPTPVPNYEFLHPKQLSSNAPSNQAEQVDCTTSHRHRPVVKNGYLHRGIEYSGTPRANPYNAEQAYSSFWLDDLSGRGDGAGVTGLPKFRIKQQEFLVSELKALCKRLGVPDANAETAARVLLGKNYLSHLTLPKTAPVTWKGRVGPDRELNPIEFQEKYWGIYIKEGALTQKTLRDLDITLFNAIKIYCQNRGIPPKEFLPPPSRSRATPKKQVGQDPIQQVAGSRRRSAAGPRQ